MRLRNVLNRMFPTPAALQPILLNINQDYNALQVGNLTHPANLLSIIQVASPQGWLLDLIDEALKAISDPDLELIRKELVPLAPLGHIHPIDACRLTGSYVMVDRADLRTALRSITHVRGKRILMVKGGYKGGKTHTLQLISYLAQALGNFDLIHIDLEKLSRLSDSKPIEPWPIAQSLLQLTGYQLELPDRPTDPATKNPVVEDANSRTWARWVYDFCEKFETAAKADLQPRWLVLDGFNNVVVEEGATDLIKELADRIRVRLHQFRLILLGFRETMPTQVIGHVAEENISKIGEEQIVEFFVRAYNELQVPADKGKIAQSLQRIRDNVDFEDPDYLSVLEPLAYEEVAKIGQ